VGPGSCCNALQGAHAAVAAGSMSQAGCSSCVKQVSRWPTVRGAGALDRTQG
jgi:hypothetical protein